MAGVHEQKAELLTVGRLFDGSETYTVPIYQRNYAWQVEQIEQLIRDIQDANDDGRESYFIGNLIVTERVEDRDEKKRDFEVVDGQQRLTTLYLLLMFLRNDGDSLNDFHEDRLRYRSRPRAAEALRRIARSTSQPATGVSDFPDDEDAGTGIRDGFDAIGKFMDKHVQKGKKRSEFTDFLCGKVTLVRAPLPEDTDLNRYFEIMNTRGQQLQPVDIVKARLMHRLGDADERACFAWIWDACSDMDSYLQMSLARGDTGLRTKLFGRTWEWLAPQDFGGLAELRPKPSAQAGIPSGSIHEEALTLDKALDRYAGVEPSLPKDDPGSERFRSTIEFPVFLLHVLNVMKGDGEESERSLDDKQLIERFSKDFSGKNSGFVRQFAFVLLRCRNLFDSFVLKRKFTASKEADDNWSLQRLKRGADNKANLDEDGDADSAAADLLLIQSMLRVTYTSPRTMHWITLLLKTFDLKARGPGEVSSDRLVRVLRDYSRRKVKEAFFGDVQPTGFAIPRIVFTYLDYLLVGEDPEWKGRYPEHVKKFRFSFRNSIEHFYPRNRVRDDPGCLVSEVCIDLLGNLALVGVRENSKFSNNMPKHKAEFTDIIEKSPKLMEMAGIARSKDWGDRRIKSHHDRMISILRDDIELIVEDEYDLMEECMSKVEWNNSKCDVLFFNSKADSTSDCEVVIGDGEIEVSYIDEGERLFYRGKEIGPGHYVLHAAGFDGEATLHRFHDGRVLEGYWVEEGHRGMWRIQLA